jgi:hypothetical protein
LSGPAFVVFFDAGRKEGKHMRAHVCGRFPVTRFGGLLIVILAIVAWSMHGPAAAEAATVTLKFDSQALDLDKGMVLERSIIVTSQIQGYDIYMAYHADRMPHAVVGLMAAGCEIAIKAGTPYDSIIAQDASSLIFDMRAPDVPFSASDTVIVKTPSGSIYKLGKASETNETVTFDYDLIIF